MATFTTPTDRKGGSRPSATHGIVGNNPQTKITMKTTYTTRRDATLRYEPVACSSMTVVSFGVSISPSGTVHRGSPATHLSDSRTVTDAGERRAALLDSTVGQLVSRRDGVLIIR